MSPVEPDALALAEAAARAGGFHESSYELRNGLEVRESEWAPDSPVTSSLGSR